MREFLGDDKEEQLRKDDLRSIAVAMFWGWVFGSLIGAVLGGYGGFLVGMFVGSTLMSLFSILGVKATRNLRRREREKAEAPAAQKTPPARGARRR